MSSFIYMERNKSFRYTHFSYSFFGESFNLWRPLLMMALYYQTKAPISFWCRRRLNPRSLIQPSEILPVELIGTHHTFLFLNQKAVDFSKTIFVLNTYHLLFLTTQKIFYLLQNLWEKKVLQRAYILRAVQARKVNQQRWLGCCILGITCRNYLSNYIGYTVDGTICLKTVT